MNAPMLVDFQKDGTTTKGLLKPARNGYLYWLKRDTDGSIVLSQIPGLRAAECLHEYRQGDRPA